MVALSNSEKGRLYRERHAEAVRIYRAAKYRNNREQQMADAEEWRQANPDRARAIGRNAAHRRRARQYAAEGGHTEREWLDLLVAYEGRCAYCPDLADTRDHVIPVARGGSNSIDNIVPACKSCNCSKGTKLLHEWVRDVVAS